MATAHLQLAAVPTAPSALRQTWTPRRESATSMEPRVLAQFVPTTLAEMDGVSLLNRIDTKFVLSEATLAAILPALASDYRVLEIDGRRAHRYRTLYFDTPDLALYRRHHAGRAVRHKVRSRTYLDTGLSFFEIKARNNKGRTLKHRLMTVAPLTSLTPDTQELLAAHLPTGERAVQPTLWNEFARITLVGNHSAERLTLDLGVRFDTPGGTAILPGVVIAELKQGGIDQASAFMRRMRLGRLRPTSVSKYCVGVAMLVPGAKHNAFKEKLRAIEKVARGDVNVR
jgi:hypothetical protein